MRKIFLIFLFLFALLGLFIYFSEIYQVKNIEAYKEQQVVLDRDFVLIRKAISQGKFEEEILKINNATVIEKKWNNKKLFLQKPLRKDRFWEFDGSLIAKVRINNENIGSEVVEMKHNVVVSINEINLEANLNNPIKKIGLINLNQKILIKPIDKSKSLVNVSVEMKISRTIPAFLIKEAENKIKEETKKSLNEIIKTIQNLPEPKQGIMIPL